MDQTDICCQKYPAVKIVSAFRDGDLMEELMFRKLLFISEC